jgi:hypothetical protein
VEKSKALYTVIEEKEMSVPEIFALINEPFRSRMTINNRDVPYNKVGVKIGNYKIVVAAYHANNIVVEKVDVWLKAESVEDLIDSTENYSGNVMEFFGNGVWLNFKLDEDIFCKVVERLSYLCGY